MTTKEKPRPVEYLSYGGGTPSAALLVANALGLVKPKAEVIVFADTRVGETEYLGEDEETYRSVTFYKEYAAEMGMELETVGSKDGALERYVRERSVPIPIYTEHGKGHRQCTDKWKIAPIEQYLHRRYGKGTPLIAQLGLTMDPHDFNRMRDPRVKRNRNRWPLIELGWTRADCINFLDAEGLPSPPPSSCEFCPLHNDATWKRQAAERPEAFKRVVALDEFLRERTSETGKGPIWLQWRRKPLTASYATGQAVMALDSFDPSTEEACDSGYCDT